MHYMYCEGTRKIRSIKGNLGVHEIGKPHHLPKDAEYLLELPKSVAHFEVLVDEWSIVHADGSEAAGTEVGGGLQPGRR